MRRIGRVLRGNQYNSTHSISPDVGEHETCAALLNFETNLHAPLFVYAKLHVSTYNLKVLIKLVFTKIWRVGVYACMK